MQNQGKDLLFSWSKIIFRWGRLGLKKKKKKKKKTGFLAGRMGVYLVLCSKLLHKHVTLYNIIWWFKYGPYLITFGFEAPKKTPPPLYIHAGTKNV